MNKKIVKICGIQDPVTAVKACELGAHWIGIIFHSGSRRYVDVKTGQEITKAVLEEGSIPVAIFVEHGADEMNRICLRTGIQVIQLHGGQSRKEHTGLPESYQRIYALDMNLSHENIPGCYPERDFLLFDSRQPGSGCVFDWKNFSYQGAFRWLLAGGLTCENVRKGILELNPFGVDVSSGVEDLEGKKDIRKIREFIEAVL